MNEKDIDVEGVKHIHFIGIGGIGISAIARMALLEGKKVTGSDCAHSEVIEELEKLGATVSIGHSAQNIQEDVDLVIYTIAVGADNPELVVARTKAIPTITYPQMLSIVSRSKKTIAVSGTHGKTTTTAMIAQMFIDAKKDPTVIVGSIMKDYKSNFIAGKSEYFIVEACEYRRSFLNLNPQVLVITNIDGDHLDYYKDMNDIKNAFKELVAKIPENGYLVIDSHAPHCEEIVASARCRIADYANLILPVTLKVPGEHNIKNAKAALAVGKIFGLNELEMLRSLAHFRGTWRRFEFKGETAQKSLVFDDYGHHPTEIKATLAGARELYSRNKITAIFQPHLYSRTKILLDDFAAAFDDADEVILAPIYAAREPFDPSISSAMIAAKINANGNQARSLSSFEEIGEYLVRTMRSDEIVITIGAGDIYKVADILIAK